MDCGFHFDFDVVFECSAAVAIGSYFVLKFKSPLAFEGGNINLKEKQ